MNTKTRHIILHKLWVCILLFGFIAILFSQAFAMPSISGENVVLNTHLVKSIFKNNTTQTSPTNIIQNKKNHSLHFRINRHFQSEKLVFILPKVSKTERFSERLPRPLFYFNNHFVSSFLYVCAGRAPPAIA